MVREKVGDPGGRELDRGVSKLLRQLTRIAGESPRSLVVG